MKITSNIPNMMVYWELFCRCCLRGGSAPINFVKGRVAAYTKGCFFGLVGYLVHNVSACNTQQYFNTCHTFRSKCGDVFHEVYT
jgi:hypothetical protein